VLLIRSAELIEEFFDFFLTIRRKAPRSQRVLSESKEN